jgi:hypothetical protein
LAQKQADIDDLKAKLKTKDEVINGLMLMKWERN